MIVSFIIWYKTIISKYVFTVYKYYIIWIYVMSYNKGNLSSFLINYHKDIKQLQFVTKHTDKNKDTFTQENLYN